jgi:membrane protease YdiL (CAAX protease family)
MFQSSPELFFPVAILIAWRALSVRPSTRGLWIDGALAILLCWYGIRVVDATQWMKRLGWSRPPTEYWGWSAAAGFLCALLVLGVAEASRRPLGTVHSVHLLLLASTAGPILEELFFRGLLYWALYKSMRHFGAPTAIVYPVSIVALAVLFSVSHIGNDTVHFWSAISTGIAFGVMRVLSGSTACAALMHASYNFTLCWLAFVFSL